MGHDIGMLVIRLALGLMLVAHGSNKAFGPGGLGGTTAWFASLGLRPAWLHARLAAAMEIAAGVLLGAGLLTGLACAAYVGLMLVAALTDHRGKGYFVFKGGCEYVLLVALVAVGVASAGPGAWSLDGVLGLEVAGAWWAVGAAAAGAGAAAGLLAASYRPPAVAEGEAG
ncbi:DoxX family protein [Streptomyces sp. NBC_01275]|uniref:DoxX family protein n=1 Tax=Streptomyces sp. NBC_01275 TaxID=2903807 RepID=UPI002253B07C|nr:DoxX family protein [Streptomyces sp. NBC_01275]MCX4767718.1 DoxX family protein [Streptomyces sp. NBC_01275]